MSASFRDLYRRYCATHMEERRTQVAIIGAGPAGLMLGRLLHLSGIDSIVIENRSEDYVIERVRAGVLEQGTVDLMIESGVGSRLQREGMFHDGIYLNVFGTRHRVDMAALTGRRIAVYGQNEVVKDLIEDRRRTGRPLIFEVSDVTVHDMESTAPRVRFKKDDTAYEIRVRLYCRLRWVSWRLPAVSSGKPYPHL